jgi:rare lipoprotein A
MKHPGYFLIAALLMFAVFGTSSGQDVYIQYGEASFYGDKFQGRTTASGETYDHEKLTAAHLTLPFGTIVKVTNLSNDKTTIVRINDRGPFVEGRVIDLSKKAARELDFIPLGVVDVKVEVLNATSDQSNQSASQQLQQDVEQQEFYELLARRVHPAGFGVQIGSFKELANLMRITENLKNSYRNEVTVQVVIINSVKVYRIIIGTFPNRSEAERLLRKLQPEYPDCFVIEFEKL